MHERRVISATFQLAVSYSFEFLRLCGLAHLPASRPTLEPCDDPYRRRANLSLCHATTDMGDEVSIEHRPAHSQLPAAHAAAGVFQLRPRARDWRRPHLRRFLRTRCGWATTFMGSSTSSAPTGPGITLTVRLLRATFSRAQEALRRTLHRSKQQRAVERSPHNFSFAGS